MFHVSKVKCIKDYYIKRENMHFRVTSFGVPHSLSSNFILVAEVLCVMDDKLLPQLRFLQHCTKITHILVEVNA
jgi:hypothetical protein